MNSRASAKTPSDSSWANQSGIFSVSEHDMGFWCLDTEAKAGKTRSISSKKKKPFYTLDLGTFGGNVRRQLFHGGESP